MHVLMQCDAATSRSSRKHKIVAAVMVLIKADDDEQLLHIATKTEFARDSSERLLSYFSCAMLQEADIHPLR